MTLSFPLLDVGGSPLAEPPEDDGYCQADEPRRGIDSLDGDVGDGGGEDDGDDGAGGLAEDLADGVGRVCGVR